jgi:4-hydroxy-tetrahydrodipicolinate reductase
MIRVIVTGALGRMGRITTGKIQDAQDLSLAAGVDVLAQEGILSSLEEFKGEADILIDFSHHTAAPGIMQWAKNHKVAVIMCTTGHTEQEQQEIRSAADTIPVFYSANMSLGVALLAELAKKTAAAFPDADIEIVETHHNRKMDAPSGTALMLGRAVQSVRPNAVFQLGRSGMGKRTAEEIGFHAIRRGNVPGIHEIIVSTDTQAITLRHEVYDRALFADGALSAVRFLAGKTPGLYDMTDIIR